MSAGTYPALGFDPAPGDPAEVGALVSTLRSTGAELTNVRNEIRAIGQVNGAWIGRAATAFVDQLGELPKYLDRATGSTDTALRALASWEHELVDFERRARVYEQRAEEARQRAAAARSTLNGLPGPGSQMTQRQLDELQQRTQAAQRSFQAAEDELSQILRAAHDMLGEHQARAGQVATQVRRAADNAPPDPGLFDAMLSGLQAIGDGFAWVAGKVQNFLEEHAELFKLIGDVLADLAMVVGIVALFVSGPFGWLVAAGVLSGLAMLSHGLAKAGGAEVSTTTLVLDGLGVLAAGAGIAGGLIAASGARTVRAGRALRASTSGSLRHPSTWLPTVGTKLRGFRTSAKGHVVSFGGKSVKGTGDVVTVGSTVTTAGTDLYRKGPSWKDIPVVGSGAALIDHFTDDRSETSRGRGSVQSAGKAFADTAAANRAAPRTAPVPG